MPVNAIDTTEPDRGWTSGTVLWQDIIGTSCPPKLQFGV
jgi:hypothetical protein